MNAYVPPTQEDLQVITEQVWASFLDVDGDGASPLIVLEALERVTDVCASVAVTGAWQGHVVVSCSEHAARHVAGALMGVELDDVTVADIADALGELANIIGGNVKSLLPEPCALSLPQVITGGGDAAHWPAVTEVCELSASWRDESITVSVLESNPDRVGVST
jgi:chemotaxis protein CheX